jgi:hypothetical protein
MAKLEPDPGFKSENEERDDVEGHYKPVEPEAKSETEDPETEDPDVEGHYKS